MVYWITGRKHSGKTTLANKLAAQIPNSVVLDGDEFRARFGNNDYSYAGRVLNQKQLTDAAAQWEQLGKVAIIACVSPNKVVRKQFQAIFKECIEIQLPFGELWPGSTYEE